MSSLRTPLKERGKLALRRHYLFFVVICLTAALLSAEFKGEIRMFSLSQSGGLITTRQAVWSDVIYSLITHGPEGAQASIAPPLTLPEDHPLAPILGHNEGVLAKLINHLSSGSILVTLASAITSITGSENLGVLLLIVLGALFFFLFWFFVQNLIPVIVRRLFLEGRTYEKVPAQRALFLLRNHHWLQASWVMLVKYVCQTLWTLTLVGGVVKYYSYFLVPYILAENPDLTARQAIGLSRKMMRGHKWECVKLDLSFLPWKLLGLFTLGITDAVYVTPYRMATFAEYYTQLRRAYKAAGGADSHLLYDTWLYQRADPRTLRKVYSDVVSVMDQPFDESAGLTGWQGFLARHFGLLVFPTPQQRVYQRLQQERAQAEFWTNSARGLSYPTRLATTQEQDPPKLLDHLNYMRFYSLTSLFVLFFGFSIFGWVWEVSLHLVSYGQLVNRGSLWGPWLPIYGSGSLLMLLLLRRFRRRPLLEFCSAVVLAGVLEYATSYVMEQLSGGLRWWDYTGFFLNLNGRICAEGLLMFGIGGMLVVYLLAPLADNFIQRFHPKTLQVVCTLLALCFCADLVCSAIHPNQGEGVSQGGSAAHSSQQHSAGEERT